MRSKKRFSASAGAIDFPVLPAILVVVFILLVLAHRAWNNTSFVSGFKIQPEDVQRTAATSLPGNYMDFTLQLTDAGAQRMSNWAATHSGEEIPIIFGGTYLGTVTLKPGMDTHVIHLTAKMAAALDVRYQLQR